MRPNHNSYLMKTLLPLKKNISMAAPDWVFQQTAGLFKRSKTMASFMVLLFSALFLQGQVNSATLNQTGLRCREEQLTITFTNASASLGNIVTLEISDAAGNFPGTNLLSNPAAFNAGWFDPFSWTIPLNYPNGTYRFKVKSTSPVGEATTATFTLVDRSITATYPFTAGPPKAVYCEDDPITVNFTTNCPFTAGNVFRLQLSNAAGSFAAPTQLGADFAAVSGSNTPIARLIPNVPRGTGYKLRIVSSANPSVVVSNESPEFEIRTGKLMTMKPANSIYCQGELLNLTYEFAAAEVINAPNTYTIQLSNDNFATITTIGRLVSAAKTGSIQAVIPYILGGTGYKIRIFASNGPLPGCEYGPYVIPSIRPNLTDPLSSYVCTGGALNLLTNGGFTSYAWQKVCSPAFVNTTAGLGNPATTTIFSIAKNGTRVYVGTGTGLSISSNSGASYTLTQLAGILINDVFVIGTNVYASTGQGIFLSTDNGNTFNAVPDFDTGNGIPVLSVNAAAADATGTTVFAATSGGFARSTNSGATFSTIFTDPTTAIFLSGTTVYAATSAGLKISYDNGASFITVNAGPGLLPSNNVTAIFVKDGIIYAGTDNGLAISTNGGVSWTSYTTVQGLADDGILSIGVANNLIYVGTSKGLSVSNLGGDGFTTISVGLADLNVYGLVAEATSATTNSLFLATLGGVATNTFTLSPADGPSPNTNNTYNIASVTPADSWCRFQVKVENNTCFLTSNQAQIADIPPNITSVTKVDPTQCGGSNGTITISGLVPNTKYQLNFTGTSAATSIPKSGDTVTTSATGQILISLIAAGNYTNIFVRSLVLGPGQATGCTSNTMSVVVSDPPAPSAVTANLVAAVCQGTNISVTLTSVLGANERYMWYTNSAGTTPANPAFSLTSSYSPASPPSATGTLYVRKRNTVTLCDGPLLPVAYTVNLSPQITHSKVEPTTASSTNGSITIKMTNDPGSASYLLQYTLPNGVTVVQVPGLTYAQLAAPTGYTISGLGVGNYTNISVTSMAGCQSNVVLSCPLLGPPPPDVTSTIGLKTVKCDIPGVAGGYFQNAFTDECASDNLVDEGVGSIAVGRIRQTRTSTANNEKVEMRGYLQFDISGYVPKNATIEKIEYRPKSLTGGFQAVCDVDVVHGNLSATGDIQFDITQVAPKYYGNFIGFDPNIFDDLGGTKYNDFTIGADARGEYTNLGAQGVTDAQNRLAQDGILRLGLTLSGTDFDLPVYQFHGIVFAPSAEHTLCITYTLRDFGDLPEPKFATDLAGGLVGPSHGMDSLDIDPRPTVTNIQPAMFIGATPPDAEGDAFPSLLADGDNNNNTNDENVNRSWFTNAATADSLIAGNSITMTFPVTNNLDTVANVIVFVDWNNNGVFENSTERYSTTVDSGTHTVVFNLAIPIFASGNVGVRVRMTSGAIFDAYGPAPDGEVEDYMLKGVAGFDYADLPDTDASTANGNYQTTFAIDGSRGPRHRIDDRLKIGNTIDAEADGQPQANAFGDDINGIDDEDGVIQPDSIIRGKPAVFKVFVTNNTGANAYLVGFADWNDDGSFEDASPNQKSGPITIPAGASGYYNVIFNVPVLPNPLPERVAARFRLSNESIAVQRSTGPVQGIASDILGEVEDTYVTIVGYDWGDLPEPRYITDRQGGQPGPSHKITPIIINPGNPATRDTLNVLYIGATPPDPELEGQPNQPATGDDTNTFDDEDLSPSNFLNPVTLLPYPLIATDSTVFRVPVTNNYTGKTATLWAFIDWNGDGLFNGVSETYKRPVPANFTGNINVSLRIPNIATSDSIGVRVRLTSGNILDAYGQAPDGEVEDFMVELRGAEYGDLPDATAGTGNNDYQTRRVYNGPRHGVPVTPLVFIGKVIDTEADGQPTERANGDDSNKIPDDEDGIVFLGPLVPGSTAQLSFSGTNNTLDTAHLHIWADWNSDGILEYVDSVKVGPTTTVIGQIVNFNVPANATFAGGKVYFRFRFTTDEPFNAKPSPNGSAADGEVEDYFLPIFKMGNLVWEDRNNNGLQDAEEINLGIQNVRVVLRFGGVDPVTGRCDSVTQNTAANPNTKLIDGGIDRIQDSVLQTYTDSKGLYCFTGLIEGVYQIISIDTFGLTPSRFDNIKNVTEEDLDSDGKPLKNPWAYLSGERRQSKSQLFKLKIDQIGTDEEGILDQGNPQLLDPNAVGLLPDDRVEQRIDFGYVGLDLGDLAESGNDPSVTNFVTSENGTKPEGPKHIVTPDLRLGNCQDVEWLGQPDADAGANFKPVPVVLGGGDDPIADFSNYPNFPYDPSQGRRWPFHDAAKVCGDDEDGIRFLTPMIAGYDAILSVKYSAKINFNGPDAYLHAWFDWNGDGNFDDGAGNIDKDEHIIFYKRDGIVDANMLEVNTKAVKLEMSYLTSANDSITLTFKVPADVKYNNGNILSRFRISFDPQLGPNGILAANLNFPDPQPGAGNTSVPGGIIPYGEVEDYFISLSKVGNTVFEDRDYDGYQDLLEPGIKNVPITLQFAGADGILNNGDPYEFTYHDTTDANGRYYFCGLIGNVDPSGIPNPVYRIIVDDPAGMTSTFNNTDPSDDSCIDDNSNGDDLLIDNRITADTFSITNPMALCLDENAPRNDVGGLLAGNNLPNPTAADALNNFPDNQYDETRDFGYTGFDYGDLPVATVLPGSNYLTLRDSMDAKFNSKFGARHAIQPRLYLGKGVDGELNGKPDADAGSKAGGDDDDAGKFKKGQTADDETGVRLLSPLLPGEFAYIKVNYTSQDTSAGGYVNKTAYLDAFIDWNGNGVMDIPSEKVEFTHQSTSANAPLTTNNIADITDTRTATLPGTGANGVDSTILAFRVPTTAVFDSGTVFMRFRLGWTNYATAFPTAFPNGLGADNNIFHMTASPYVKSFENNLPANPILAPPNNWTDAAGNTGRYPYPQGELEDYAIPVAKIGNLAWFDHDVFGDQDANEDVVDSLHIVLIWGGVNGTTGAFDTVGYQTSLSSLGSITDILYNRTIAPPSVGTYAPGALVKTGISPAADSGLYSFRGLIPGIYYVLPIKYFATDSASFVNAWPKHRVVTLQDNPGVDDNNDSDGRTKGVAGTSRGPGAFVKITDSNSRQPEVEVNDRPIGENGKRDAADSTQTLTPAFFPNNQGDRSVDFGWVDEPNVEASMDIVGVDFPTSLICGNFNVITHLCVKNPQEVPLDSFQMFFNLTNAYGTALYTPSKPIVTIVDSAFITSKAFQKVRKSSLVNFGASVNAKAKDLLVVNPNYNGTTDTKLLVPTSEGATFLLRGDSILCVQIEFEIDPTKTEKYPWMLSASVTARAIGFNKQTGGKRPLTDFRFFHPRFGKSIVAFDSTDEFDDPMPMAGLTYPDGGDNILFEGMVADRGLKGDYQVPYVSPNVTGRDKYADEDDKAIQNDSCWIKTKWNSGYREFSVALDAKCEAVVNADLLVPNFIAACGFDKYPMGSYYRVIIQDKDTEETLWASVDRVPFDVRKYLNRNLIYKVRSVANHCNVIWGPIIFTDKIPPVVTCPPNTSRKVSPTNTIIGTYTFVCTDIDSVLNVAKSWSKTDYPYYTGLATATDACSEPRLENVKDEIVYFSDCNTSASNGYIYAQIRRTFIFSDRMGNKANCSQLISFYRPTIKLPNCKIDVPNDKAKGDSLILPIDLIGSKYNLPLSVPYFINGAGKRIYITGKDYCGFAFNYTDEAVFVTGQGRCGKKILRTWSIFDWCYGTGNAYPNFLMQPDTSNSCYIGSTWSGGRFSWQQTIIVGDHDAPIIYALDIDRDGKVGRYEGAPKADPKKETNTYDPDDVLIYSTGPMDCTGNFVFNRTHFKVVEQSDWCYDIRVVERVAILDLDERPTGEFVLKIHPFVKITGDCAKGFTVTGVPMKGDWFVEVRVYDACYSESTALIPVRIMDLIAPVMKCDDKLNITLNNVGNGYVAASDLDEGSWDNCTKLNWVKVRRPVVAACEATFLKFPRVIDVNKNNKIDTVDYIDLNGNRIIDAGENFSYSKASKILMTPLMDTVPFFCCDGGSLMVELWGEDKAGNRNYCWNNIQIEDKTPIECVAPWTTTIFCNDKNLQFIDDKKLSAKAYGDVVIVRGAVCINADTAYSVVKKLKCGAGTIERIWTLTKQTAKGPVVSVCRQIIKVLPLREYNICFPKDVDQRDCKTPVIDTAFTKELGCDILAVNVTDKRYDASNDECYKIFRTYTVIDWCAYDDNCGDPTADGIVYVVDRSYSNYGKTPIYVLVRDADQDQREEFYLSLNETPNEGNVSDSKVGTGNDEAFVPAYCENAFSSNPYGLPVGEFYHAFQYTQIIKVYDDVKPVVTGDQAKFCIRDGGDCLADLKMIVKGTDNCTDQVTMETNLLAIAPFQTRDAGSMIGYSTSRWSVKILTGGQFEINVSNLPQGKHDLIVVVRDECGNLSEPTRIPFTVEDCKGPAPICINGLSTSLMPDGNGGGMITVWATDLVASKVFDCNGQGPENNGNGKLVTKYSINRVGSPAVDNQTSLIFNCKDAGAGKVIQVELHAWDNAGNHDFCVTFIEVQDNRKLCNTGDPAVASITGLIATDESEPVVGVSVDVSGASTLKQITANSGAYAFTNLTKGADFSLSAQLDKDHVNGVSTFDLVLIQKHILGTKLIDNPYRQIAADVNNSKSISTLDMIQIRKLILQVDDKFKNVPSWKFVDAAYRFPDASNPFGAEYTEVINVNNLTGNVKADFVAIKMGDVNGNAATVNGIAATEIRTNRHLLLAAEEQVMKVDGSYEVAIRAKDLQNIQGYQFTLTYAQNLVELEGIVYGVTKADNFGIFKDKGAITTSWNLNSGVGAAGNEVLFTLKLKAKANTKLSEVLNISSRLTPAEAYDKENETIGVKLSFGEIAIQDFAVLRQNTPNPFSDETSVGFYLPKAAKGILTIRDTKGSLIYRINGTYSKGENKIVLKQAELRASGVLYYTLETADFIDTKKMILLNR